MQIFSEQNELAQILETLTGVHFASPINDYICGNKGTLLKYVAEE